MGGVGSSLRHPEGIEERRLLAPQRPAEEWTLLYPVRLRPKLAAGRFTPPDPGWWQMARLDPERAVWAARWPRTS